MPWLRLSTKALHRSPDLLAKYNSLVATGAVQSDPEQRKAMLAFQRVANELTSSHKRLRVEYQSPRSLPTSEQTSRSQGGFLGSLFGGSQRSSVSQVAQTDPLKGYMTNHGARGVYLYGGSGTGKTYLMDLFYESLDLPTPDKQRVHFHEWITNIHKSLYKMRYSKYDKCDTKWTATAASSLRESLKENSALSIDAAKESGSSQSVSEDDLLTRVAHSIAEQSRVLFLDELQVVHITDAVLVRRIWELLFPMGVTLVTTSNRHPTELYKDGLNRQLFVPFIDQVQKHCELVKIETTKDYRRQETRDDVGKLGLGLSAGQSTLSTGPSASYAASSPFMAEFRSAFTPLSAASDSIESINLYVGDSRTRTVQVLAAGACTKVDSGSGFIANALKAARRPIRPLSEQTVRSILTAGASLQEVIKSLRNQSLKVNSSTNDSQASSHAAKQVPLVAGVVSFEQLMRNSFTGSEEYYELAQCFNLLYLIDCPKKLLTTERDVLRRFITFVDVVYDSHLGLITDLPSDISIDGWLDQTKDIKLSSPANSLLSSADSFVSEESFAWTRTASRLHELLSR